VPFSGVAVKLRVSYLSDKAQEKEIQFSRFFYSFKSELELTFA